MTVTLGTKEELPYFDISVLHRLLFQSPADDSDFDTVTRYWKACRPWLQKQGYTIFDPGCTLKDITHRPSTCTTLPYGQPARTIYSATAASRPYFAFGVDEQKRDVVLKIVVNDTQELNIYNRLLGGEEFESSESFPCVLPPVAILPTPYSFSFVVTPRWGECTVFNNFTVLSHLLHYIRCALTGLAYLHSMRIVHRDLNPANIMHRWFDPINWQAQLPEAERELGGTLYCVMDYDLSLLHDEALDLNCYFRPVAEAWVGRARYHPDDYSQGEWRYNPFAFDVACLGGMIRSNYADAIAAAPLLAPLLDKMTTHVISDRFTAAEALRFVNLIIESSSIEHLRSAPVKRTRVSFTDISSHWSSLPRDFVAQWRHFRTPPIPLVTRLLRWICRYETCWKLVYTIRRTLHL